VHRMIGLGLERIQVSFHRQDPFVFIFLLQEKF
jgi:hypothetical protein